MIFQYTAIFSILHGCSNTFLLGLKSFIYVHSDIEYHYNRKKYLDIR